jgi:hypothetical protein
MQRTIDRRQLFIAAGYLAASFALGGCATSVDKQSAGEIASKVEVKDSNFDQQIAYIGPEILNFEARGLLNDHQRLRLRAWKSKPSGDLTYQLYAKIWFNTGGWRHYRTVSFPDATQSDVVRIDADVQCMGGGGYTSCSHEETVGVPLSAAFLNANGASGFTIRLNSQSGTQSFLKVPANYVQGFLLRVSR